MVSNIHLLWHSACITHVPQKSLIVIHIQLLLIPQHFYWLFTHWPSIDPVRISFTKSSLYPIDDNGGTRESQVFPIHFKVITMHELFKILQSPKDDENVSGKKFFSTTTSRDLANYERKTFFSSATDKTFRWKFACLYIVIIMQLPEMFRTPKSKLNEFLRRKPRSLEHFLLLLL